MATLSENMGTIVETKSSDHANQAGASFGTAGCPQSEICLPNSRPRLLGVPSPRARVECPACSGISLNTLKFIDLDRAGFSVSETERPRTDSRLLGSSVDRPTKCRGDEIGWNGACASYAAPSCLLQKAAHAAQRRGCGVAISSGTANPKSFPSIQPFTRSPDRLAAIVAVDDWDFFVAFVAPTLNGGTEERTAAQ